MAWYYYAGGAVALAGIALIARGGSKQAPAEDSEPTGTPMAAPLFMAGGGGTSQPGTSDGVSAWVPPKVPLADNPDVAIAKINADVNRAAIDAAAKLYNTGTDIVRPTAPTNPTPNTTASPPPNTNSNKPEYRGSSIAEGAAYIKDLMAHAPANSSEDIEMTIYRKAKEYDYSPTEVAKSFSQATGSKISVETVNKWLKDRGLSL